MTDLTEAMAHIKVQTPDGEPWIADEVMHGGFTEALCASVATILNAIASGALVPVETVEPLVDAAKWVRGAAQEGFRTADFHRGECSCPRCAEDALTAWENRND